MARRIVQLMVPIVLLAAAACGCSTAPSRFYTLDATAVSDGTAPVSYPIMVGPVSVPAAVDRPEFVVETAPNRVEVDEFNRWAAPINDAVAQVVAGDLVKLLGTPNVAAGADGELRSRLSRHHRHPALRFFSESGRAGRGCLDGTQHGWRRDALWPHGRTRGRRG